MLLGSRLVDDTKLLSLFGLKRGGGGGCFYILVRFPLAL